MWPVSHPFTYQGDVGCIDAIEGPPQTILRVFGWFNGASVPGCRLKLKTGQDLVPISVARVARPDVVALGLSPDLYCGFRADFLIQEGDAAIRLTVGDGVVDLDPDEIQCSSTPHYNALFNAATVLKREDIYGFGPPTSPTAEISGFVQKFVAGDILDFGCGNGAMVRYLRHAGLNVIGIELDEPRIQDVLSAEVRDYVRLYEGGLPLPFADGSFDAIYSVEVIEHIAGIADFIPEFWRILRPDGRLVLTTPDISAIPSSFPALCVPWHLLESTHVNFFTPTSITRLFAPSFRCVSLFSLSAVRINGLFVPGSIGAVLEKTVLEKTVLEKASDGQVRAS